MYVAPAKAGAHAAELLRRSALSISLRGYGTLWLGVPALSGPHHCCIDVRRSLSRPGD